MDAENKQELTSRNGVFKISNQLNTSDSRSVVNINLSLQQFRYLIQTSKYVRLRKRISESLVGIQSDLLWRAVTSHLSLEHQKSLKGSAINELMEEHFSELVSNAIDSLIDTVNDILRKKIVLLQELPTNLDQYKNSYILVNKSQLYYLTANMELKPIEILKRETFMAALDEQINNSNIIYLDDTRYYWLFVNNVAFHDLLDEIINLNLSIDVTFDFTKNNEHCIEVVNSGEGFKAEQINRLNNLQDYVLTKKASVKTRGEKFEHLGGRAKGLADFINACCFDTIEGRHVRLPLNNIVFSNDDATGHAKITITMPVAQNELLHDIRDFATPLSTTTEELTTTESLQSRPLSTNTEERSTTESLKSQLSLTIDPIDDNVVLDHQKNASPIFVPPKKNR